LWKLADEERSRSENYKKSSFSDTQQVRTGRCKFLFFWKIFGAIGIGNLEWLGEGLGSRITANLRDVCGTAEEHTSL